MKKLIVLLQALLACHIIFAQTPVGFSYQAVLRNTSGEVLGSQAAQLRVTLISSNGLTTHYQELHNVTSTAQGLINAIIGDGSEKVGVLADVPWGNDQITMKTEIKVGAATTFTLLGTQPLQAVPYALYANNAKEVESSPTAGDDDPIFVVKNRLGQVVFAVYQEGVRVFVDDGTTPTKGTKGGFAVGGLSGTKLGVEYFKITPDSARIYIDDTGKGAKGGFAVGGLSGVKSDNSFFNVSVDATGIINPSQNRVLWYPLKNAFIVGRVLVEHPDSVGTNSFASGYESKAKGEFSQALGYRAIARGNYSTAIGKRAVANTDNSFALGDGARTLDIDAYAIGAGASAAGQGSYAIGSFARDTSTNLPTSVVTKAEGDFSFAIGLGAKSTGAASMSLGANTLSSGAFSNTLGFYSVSSGDRALALGTFATASGYGSVALGYKNVSSGGLSFSAGVGSTSAGYASIALGAYCKALGNKTVAMGEDSEANGYGSFAMGKSAEALTGLDFAMGTYVTADGGSSFAFGKYCSTNGKEGAVVFNVVSGKNGLTPSKSYQINFKAEKGFRFFSNADTLLTHTVVFDSTGFVGIGTKTPNKNLHVVGDARITGSIFYGTGADIYNKPDFVFSKAYTDYLDPLEVDVFIRNNGHLPWVTKATNETDGINLTRMQFETLETVENMQLQIINIKKEYQQVINEQKKEIDYLKAELAEIKKLLAR